MNTSPFDAFRDQALAEGFDEVLERRWAPNTVLGTHTHPFSVKAFVAEGEMWLSCGEGTQHLRAGAPFSLGREVPHAERYGEAGAVVWVARRHAG